ncbi:HEAT repeat-containing protein 5B [Sinocyclocheilus rhinocerous]|uniref:HEAT repeat-containing protein 5B n=1 Tax=Sinocyclocheilus rhinocerous TaxID=307959 RepID=UPI0007B80EE9|nr:PREDICTED: HEAT repeat-containing protein 5B [Sinocyclocheilus rhinocerous]
MELAHSLLLNEEALAHITEAKRAVFVFEWLRFLDKVLIAANKVDVKEKQKKLVEQLTGLISSSPGPPTRKLLAKNLAVLYSIGDTFTVFQTLDKCNDIIRSKDDTAAYLPTKLNKPQDTVHYTRCLLELQNEAVFIWTTELENVATLCFKALEGSTYSVRVSVSTLLGTAMATALMPKQATVMRQNVKRATLEEVLELMATGFLRGGSGFLKSGGEMLKGASVSREVRVGVTQAYVVFVTTLGGQWLERNFAVFLSHLLELVAHPRATQTHVEAVYSRRCVSFALRASLGGLLGEKAQIAAAKEICLAISKQMRAVEAVVNDPSSENRAGAADVSASQHVMVCALKELGSLVQSLSATASPLIQEPSVGFLETVTSVLLHPSMAARLAAAWCLRCVAVALPHQLTPLLERCAECINNLKNSPEAVSGYSFAMAALLGGVHQCPLGIPHSKGKMVVSIAEDLLRSAAQNSRLSLQRTQAGWLLLGALMTLGPSLVRYHLPKMLLLWRNVFPRSQKELELQPNSASGSGALEHDPSSIYLRVPAVEAVPGPLPLGVSVIDASVALFGVVFPHVSFKHRLQMLDHFAECIKQAKGVRQQAVQLNIFTAVLSALKGLAENKSSLGPEEVRKSALALVMGALDNPNPILRCAAGEALGRMAQVVGEASFIARMAQHSFDKLKSARDVVSRTGHSLALGCLHRYVGGIGSGQHLKTSVSILLALAQDATCHEVQTWALHSLALIVDSSGPMYRGYVEPTLSLVLTLLLTVPPSHTEVHQCLGRCLGALITTVGPELQGNSVSISTIRSSCLVGCAIMQDHSDSLVQAAAISCLQQLHMFAPRHVNLSSLVPSLCVHLCSSHLLLRRAAVACLRQLAQREAAEVCEYAMSLARKAGDGKDSTSINLNITETGLEGVLFGMLDRETDRKLCSDIHDTLGHMLSSLAVEKLPHWLKLCKDVLAATTEVGGTVASVGRRKDEEEDSEKKDEMDDDIMFTSLGQDDKSKPSVAPRWVTRVFAADCLCRIIHLCENADKAHFDLAAARVTKAKNPEGDFLVLHLCDLIRMAFMAATDHSNQLRMAGLQALEDIIKKFAAVPEPEFPGHVILEQYQANVGAALRPAFSPDTPSDITAKACQVCSTWIGSGVVSDLNDLRRVHNLLVSSLDKVQTGKSPSSQLYSESATTMEKLAVLKAWAEVFVVAMNIKKESQSKPARPPQGEDEDEGDEGDVLPPDSLMTLVQPELPSLSRLWLAVLRDYALLTLPAEFSSQLPPEGGAFYTPETIDTARLHYRSSWASVLHAEALWLSSTGFGSAEDTGPVVVSAPGNSTDGLVKDRLHLLLGISIEFLCFPRAEEPIEDVMSCLHALCTLLDSPSARTHIAEDQLLAVELLNVLHRLLLTRDPPSVQLQVTTVVQKTIRAAQEHLEHIRSSKSRWWCMTACAERSMTILPTVLFLITGVLRDTAVKTSDNSVPAPVSASLQAIKTILSSPLAARSQTQWSALVRSSLATVLQHSQPDACGVSVDEVSLLTAVTLFLLSASGALVGVSVLQTGCIERFRHGLDSADPWTQARCYQLLLSVFQHSCRSLSTPYIHSLAPVLVEKLKAIEHSRPSTPAELQAVQEGVKVLESLVAMGEEHNRVQLLALLVPTLVSYLLDDTTFSTASTSSKDLHEFALQNLMHTGPLYPAAFKTVIGVAPELKTRLEAAIRSRQANSKAKTAARQQQPTVQAAPTIKLKTSFF